MWQNIERLFEVHKTIIEWFLFYFVLFYQSSQYEKLVSSVVIFVKLNLMHFRLLEGLKCESKLKRMEE